MEIETGGIDTASTSATTEDFSEWDGAVLEILSPTANEFLALGEESEFEFVMWSADGDPLNPAELDNVIWRSSLDATWSGFSAEFDDDDLSVGTHTIKASATLPNGQDVFDAVGGVLVQHENAGTYAGLVITSTEVDETQVSCAGGAVMVVDANGEGSYGEATCYLGFQGQEIELIYEFNLEFDGSEAGGVVEIKIGGWGIPFDYIGSIYNGSITGEWTGTISGLADIDGSLDVERISRDTSWGQ
jgi:hypothetical protein